MLYMLELHYSREYRDHALSYFWEHGSTRYEGEITVKQAWVATKDFVAYALVNAKDAHEIDKATAPLKPFGEVYYRPVTNVDAM